MADYTGDFPINNALQTTRVPLGFHLGADISGKIFGGGEMTSEKSHGGSYSRKLYAGDMYTIDYGCNAGETTISVWVWPETGAIFRLEILDPYSLEIINASVNVGAGAWEQVTVTFTAQKKVYLVRICNYSNRKETSKNCWVDNLE